VFTCSPPRRFTFPLFPGRPGMTGLAVTIPTHRGRRRIRARLHSALARCGVTPRVAAFERAPRDGTRDRVRSEFPQAEFIANKRSYRAGKRHG
jgi:hypothetical protein